MLSSHISIALAAADHIINLPLTTPYGNLFIPFPDVKYHHRHGDAPKRAEYSLVYCAFYIVRFTSGDVNHHGTFHPMESTLNAFRAAFDDQRRVLMLAVAHESFGPQGA